MSKEQLSAFINKRVAGYRKYLKERSAEEAAARFKKISEGNKKYQASVTEEQKEARRARGAAWWAGLTGAQRAAISAKLKASAKRRLEAKKLAEASNTHV
jgi:hypothetical protein